MPLYTLLGFNLSTRCEYFLVILTEDVKWVERGVKLKVVFLWNISFSESDTALLYVQNWLVHHN